MEFKWQELESDNISYTESEKDDPKIDQGMCNVHTPDCGAIKNDDKCQCGELKTSHHSLCTSCHSILPEDLKIDVDWCPEVYQAAVEYLND